MPLTKRRHSLTYPPGLSHSDKEEKLGPAKFVPRAPSPHGKQAGQLAPCNQHDESLGRYGDATSAGSE
ncbi:hypothetical protein STEG23_016421, partial [Scotinomys teguina]